MLNSIHRYSIVILLLFLLPSCNSGRKYISIAGEALPVSRTAEQILRQDWGLRVHKSEYILDLLIDEEGEKERFTEIRMKVALSEKQIDKLISKGARNLPFSETLYEYHNGRLELTKLIRMIASSSGLLEAKNGVYYFEEGNTEDEGKILLYDRDSQTLFYYWVEEIGV